MELQFSTLITAILLLGCLQGINSQESAQIQRNHTCDFEPLTTCGWIIDTPSDGQGTTGIATSGNRPALGPATDTTTGDENGQYFYFTSDALSQPERILEFPSYSQICGLSFSYYVSGPLDLGLLFEDYAYRTVYMTQSLNGTSSTVWGRQTLSLNATENFDGSLFFEVSPFDIGEAAVDPTGYDLFLGLDDITLTFCLPCDYDALDSAGGLTLEGPNELTVRLRVTSQMVYNGTSLLCPNEPLEYSIDSVEPPQVASIFTIDATSGTLFIRAQGDGLEPSGVEDGRLTVSVHIPGSNYSNTSPPVSHSIVVTFHQPPTIIHTAPSTLPVNVGSQFSYQFTVSSALGQDLSIGTLRTNPSGLVDDISITITGREALVSGMISLTRDLPEILENSTIPEISIPVVDAIGGVITVTTQLIILESPPLFTQSHYEFEAMEGSNSGIRLGPISIVDPNAGHAVGIPMIIEDTESKLFRPISGAPSGVFSNFFILVDLTLDFEHIQEYDFTLVVNDTADPSLASQATVRVNVLPVNEFNPVFIESDLSVEISDTEPAGHFVAEFDASDRDTGADGQITYSITSGNNDGFFEIAAPTFGEVTIRRSPIQPHTYNLIITASDSGNPRRTADTMLTVQVIATQMIDCTEQEFGPPQISSVSTSIIEVPVTSQLTLECQYTANPIVTVYKWVHIDGDTILESDDHYTVNPYSLVIQNLTVEDAGIYDCNVTNQCGANTLGYLTRIIDYPDPPLNPEVVRGPDINSFSLVWDPPVPTAPNPNVVRPLNGYEVWARAEDSSDYQTVATVDPTVMSADITGLHPGTFYWVVVASVNPAGPSPSEAINITTMPSVPKLLYLRATEEANHSILIEWDLQYDGGSSIISFEIHVILQADRARRAPPDLIYHVEVSTGHLVTRSVDTGKSYTVMATLFNSFGSSDMFAYVYVGPKDTLLCDFETLGNTDCYWQLDNSEVILARDAPSSLHNTDASGNPLGHYISAQANTEEIVMSYNRAWYSCGYSFSYLLSSEGVLTLRTTSGSVVWSGSSTASEWLQVEFEGEQFLTSSQDEGLQFVLEGNNAVAGIDDVDLTFCLPCDLSLLRERNGFNLTYLSNVDIFLRTEQEISLAANLLDCPSAVIDFTTTRVIPGELESSFSLSHSSPQALTISIAPIPSDTVLPHTAGFIEVVASVVHSDYESESDLIERVALIEFILLAATENCSISQTCGFEDSDAGCNSWELGSGVQHVTGSTSPLSELQSNQGTFLYGDYTSTTIPSSAVASSQIGDTFCAVAFSYSAPPTIELVVSVDGLGQVWSSLLVSEGTGWITELVPIDLESVSLSNERRLNFSAGQSDGFGEAAADTSLPAYIALDDIILHPCIDCNTPECIFTSCTPGRFFSLEDQSCISCPKGHYCPDWRDLPIPCPPGTYSEVTNAASQSVCMMCPRNAYSLTPGSTSCTVCPSGFTCANSSHYPLSSNQCPSATPGTSQPETVPMLAVIVGGAAGGVALILCLLLSCVIGCWCYKTKRERQKRKDRAQARRMYGEDITSIGSAGSLGRSSMGMSTFDGRGRRWMKGRDVSTLMSFLSDDDDREGREASWEGTEELTKPVRDNGGQSVDVMFKNDGYEGEDELQLVDLGHHGDYQKDRSHKNNTSRF